MKGIRTPVVHVIALLRNDEPSFAHPPGPPDKDRLALWVTVGLLGLFCVAFIIALLRNDSDLLNKVLPYLIAFLVLALKRLFKEPQEDDEQPPAED
jgi:hypothetical protein